MPTVKVKINIPVPGFKNGSVQESCDITESITLQDRDIVRMAMHPGFSGKNLTDNVALLFTNQPFVLGSHLDKICLPSSAIYPRYNPDECYATGWGKDAFGDEGKFQAREQNILNFFFIQARVYEAYSMEKV